MNHPQGNYSVARAVEKMQAFNGAMILQTMFLRGTYQGVHIDNTTDAELDAWLRAVDQIRPSEIMIYTLDRATPAPDLQKITKQELETIANKAREQGYIVQVAL